MFLRRRNPTSTALVREIDDSASRIRHKDAALEKIMEMVDTHPHISKALRDEIWRLARNAKG